jgi:hypothetical protein
MVSSTTQSSYAKQRSKAIEIGFDSLLTLSQQSLVVQKTPETLVNRGFSKRQQFLSFSRK